MSEANVERARWLARSLGRGDLAPLAPTDVELLAGLTTERRVPAGGCLFYEDETPAQVHVVRAGSVELTRLVGGRKVGLQVLRAGDVFGDVPVLMQMAEPVSACALEDSVVLSMEPTHLWKLLETHPRIAKRWMISLAARLAKAQDRVSDLLAGPLDAQLASFLLHENQDGDVTLSQEQLARSVGATRSSVNQTLKRFESQGHIELGYRRVSVRDPDALAALL